MNQWHQAKRLDLREKIKAADLAYKELPQVKLKFDHGEVIYTGQKPQRDSTFIGRIETEYSVKEGEFIYDPEEPGEAILNGYGRVFYPNCSQMGRFAMGKYVTPAFKVAIKDEDIPDSRIESKQLFGLFEKVVDGKL